MATAPDNLPVGPTQASRPSKMIIVLLIGVVIAFFAITMTQDITTESQPAATSAAPSRD